MRIFLFLFFSLYLVKGLIVNEPESVRGHYRSIYTTVFGTLPREPLTNYSVVRSNPLNGCYRIATQKYDGKIVIIDRGTCLFATKLKVAQDQGAVAVIMVNRVPNAGDLEYDKVGGVSNFIEIPSIWINNNDGEKLKQVIGNLSVTFQTSPIRTDQKEALVDFVQNADNKGIWRTSNALLTSFIEGDLSPDFDPCQTPFRDGTIACDEYGYITSIAFAASIDLSGVLSRSMEKFSRLVILELPNSKLQGPIPDVFYSMSGISYINLIGNNLTGNIPMSLLASPSLFTLKLESNLLTGNLNGINLPNIQCIQLDANYLTGSIPDSLLTNSSNLVTVSLSSNRFSGKFSFPKPIVLDELDLSVNQFSGGLESSFRNVTIRWLNLFNNSFTGSLTQEMIGVAQHLDISCNFLTDFQDFESSTIDTLVISNNPFNSVFPSIFADRLKTFEAVHCGLKNLPDSLVLPLLQYLDFSNNPMNTALDETGALLGTELVSMKCRNCGLTGNVIMFYQSPINSISIMDLSHNDLEGNLDLSYFHDTITSVDFSYNNISGVISDTFTLFTQIQVLNLQGNPNFKSKDGNIPQWLKAVYPSVPIVDPLRHEYCPTLKSIEREIFQVIVSPEYYNNSLCYCGRGYYRDTSGPCLLCPSEAYCPGGTSQYIIEYPAPVKNSTSIEFKSSIDKKDIIGIVVGISAFLLIVIIISAILVRRRRKYRNHSPFDLIDITNFNLGDAKSCVIDENEIEDISEIGRGAFGVVFKGTWRQLPVAIKQMKTRHSTHEELSEFVREVSIIKGLRAHPNVVLFLGITFPPQNLSLVTELCEGGSLYEWLKKNPKVEDSKRFEFLRGIARGMIHLTLEGVVHRDLASRNILLSGENLRPKVSDFGLSRVSKEDSAGTTASDTGPLQYMSPEAIRFKQYSQKSDVFSYGVVIWELVTCKDPWGDLTPIEAAIRVTMKGDRLPIPETCDPFLSKMMKACWEGNPDDRPTFNEICSSLEEKNRSSWTSSLSEIPVVTNPQVVQEKYIATDPNYPTWNNEDIRDNTLSTNDGVVFQVYDFSDSSNEQK